jgi:DNA mismatch repair protein MutS
MGVAGVMDLTPAMRQYLEIKEQHPDCILFFRMGDFYETFYDDAKICSRICGLALTSRNKGDNPVPLAGVPYHAVESYLKKMLLAGYKAPYASRSKTPESRRAW